MRTRELTEEFFILTGKRLIIVRKNIRKFLLIYLKDTMIPRSLFFLAREDLQKDFCFSLQEIITFILLINSPDILKDIPERERHIIICIKGYNGVVNQLKDMGIMDYHIYDPGNDYPNKSKEHVAQSLAQTGDSGLKESDIDKPYNIGYIAGVFDLFHVGHLNMFKRAKEQCRYLIVGVVSDEGVRLNKQAEPYVPFEERIEMVRSCRYVDEAVKLPLNFAGTRDMFKKYHFDVQFSGSDYEHDPAWLSEKEFLEKNGSTMVFFPYTQSTSSTKLKKAIESKIKQ